MHKHDLQALAVDKHFVDHKLSRTDVGRNFSAIVLDSRFWNDCYEIVNIVTPLVKLLRIVDSDEKPSLPYVYEGMQRAKNGIKEMFKRDKNRYKPYTNIIQARWDKHLKTNLHAASYLLNPAFMYGPDFMNKGRLMTALIEVVEANSARDTDYFSIMKQASLYIDGKESFGREICKKSATKFDPCKYSYLIKVFQ